MQSQILRPNLQWGCLLLLVFTAIRVGATVEEGTILRIWAMNNNNSFSSMFSTLASWNNGSSDPCGIDANWYGVSCGGSSNVLKIFDIATSQDNWCHLSCDNWCHLSYDMRLDYNLFSGFIPQEIGNLSARINLTLTENILTGSIPASLGSLTKLEYLDLESNFLRGTIPQGLANLPALSTLMLSQNRLTDPIPDFGSSSNLKNLDLSNNSIMGSYPESLARLPFLSTINLYGNLISGNLNQTRIQDLLNTTAATYNLPDLTQVVNLMYNNISGVLPLASDDLQIRSRVAFLMLGNPYCAGPSDNSTDLERCLCQPALGCHLPGYPQSAPGRKIIIIGIIIGFTCGAVILLLAIICGVSAIVKGLARRKLCELEEEYKHKFAEFEVNPQPFLFKEIRNATQDFDESTKLGQGGFGTVYKGILSNGNEIAIKKLEPKLAAQGDVDDFLNEVVFITKMRHPNLVNLKGYCIRGKERMLVYEYVENMDVEQSLLVGKNKEAMTWPMRNDASVRA